MVLIREILAEKGRHMITISAHATILDAAILMNDHKIGSLLVMDEGQMIGILTERDILVRVVAEQRNVSTTPVEDVMTREVICCRPHTSLEEARGAMKNHRVRHLPVMSDEGEVLGVISIGDLNAYQVNHQEKTIYLLEAYIQGQV